VAIFTVIQITTGMDVLLLLKLSPSIYKMGLRAP